MEEAPAILARGADAPWYGRENLPRNVEWAARPLLSLGALLSMTGVGWKLGVGSIQDGRKADSLLVMGLAAFIIGFVGLTSVGKLDKFLKAEGKPLLAVAVVGSMIAFGVSADPHSGTFTDRVLVWAFVVFVVGLAELFVLLVVSSVLGKIDLTRAFFEKGAEADAADEAKDDEKAPKGEVSLSRLQSFLWTLVVMIIYFYEVVKSVGKDRGLPTIPVELLMVMGISGAVYLTSKGMSQRPATPPPPPEEKEEK